MGGRRFILVFRLSSNGYLHIGHAKAMYVNFKIAEKFNGKCNLRFDDKTPPKTRSSWKLYRRHSLDGLEWNKLTFGSEYFDICYEKAVLLIKKGLAYVCDLSKDEIREYRGTLRTGINSPYRDKR